MWSGSAWIAENISCWEWCRGDVIVTEIRVDLAHHDRIGQPIQNVPKLRPCAEQRRPDMQREQLELFRNSVASGRCCSLNRFAVG